MKIFKTLKKINLEGENLSQKVVRGSFWVFGSKGINLSLYFLKIIILSNILSPADFGLAGIGLLWIEILKTFTEIGFNTALIQKKGDIQKYTNSAWTFLIYRGIALFIFSLFIAPYLSLIFDAPEATNIIIILGLSCLIEGFININVIKFQKNLEFKKYFIYWSIINITDFAITILFAIFFKNAWAIVIGTIFSKIAAVFSSFILSSETPSISWNLKYIKGLFNYSKWIMLTTIFAFIITQGDDLFVGWLLGVEALGLYQMAYKISNTPSTEISIVFDRLSFPTYCKLQDNFKDLNLYFENIQQVSYIITFFLIGIIFNFSKDFTILFMGSDWISMIPTLKILAIWAIFRVIGGSLSNILKAIGKPKINAITLLIQAIIIIIIIYPFSINFGLEGAAFSILISAISIFFIRIIYFVNLTGYGYKRFFKPIFMQLLCILSISIIIYVLNQFLIKYLTIFSFLIEIIIYTVIFLSFNYIYEKILNFKFLSLLKLFLQNI